MAKEAALHSRAECLPDPGHHAFTTNESGESFGLFLTGDVLLLSGSHDDQARRGEDKQHR